MTTTRTTTRTMLVTGGTGFLGRHVVWRLAAAGHDVVFTGRDAAEAAVVEARSPRPSVRFVPIEHGRDDAVARLTTAACGADAIVHCAAFASPWGPRAAFERANVASAREVVRVAEVVGVRRLVHVSTPALHFAFADRLEIREDDALPRPANAYVATKAMAEAVVARAAIAHVIVLRPRAIFGPWDRTLLPRLLRVARRGPLPLLRGGSAQVDLTYVDNVVDAVELALASPRARATCHVSNGEPLRVADLFGKLARAFDLPPRTRRLPYPPVAAAATALEAVARLLPGWEPPLTRYTVGLLAYSQTLDLSRAKDELGYRPRVGIDEGLRRTAEWFATEAA